MEIRLERVTVTYGKQTGVEDLSAVIPNGAFVSLLGPSGCGKSTTLHAIGGLLEPESGTISFDGKRMNKIPPEHREIGMVFQSYSLYPHMTAYENICFPLRMKKWPKSDMAQRVAEISDMLQIGGFLDRKPERLSGGQQQRVAIARALVKNPRLLLLDEPLSNLDAKLRLELRDELRQLQRKLGITAILVTHDQDEAMSVSDRILLMREGRLVQYGTPQELYKQPVNSFAAQFIGHPPMNLIPFARDRASLQHALRPPAAANALLLGVRAEDWLLCDPQAALLAGTILSAESTGRDTILKVRAGNAILRLYASDEYACRVGQTIHLNVRAGREHWFDERTGERLSYDLVAPKTNAGGEAG